ncbi:hypothetical protein EIP91_008246 [Steccherinum ochraceum]|uniref:SUN domain-containing protein n=1 Tax=Steccherinum ochraceum TaxID=92696 RepID=A0A4R0R355_9APHY|nr:hypothetical protein EIP91_008246 [Steccherinum ochraceum]
MSVLILGILVASGWSFLQAIFPSHFHNTSPTLGAVMHWFSKAPPVTLADEIPTLENFAAKSHGSRVVLELTSPPKAGLLSSLFRTPAHGEESRKWAESVLEDESNREGDCWEILDTKAQLGIRLHSIIHPTSVTIHHLLVPAENKLRAPRQMVIWGVVENQRIASKIEAFQHLADQHLAGVSNRPLLSPSNIHHTPLASFEYNISSTPTQTFDISPHIRFSGADFGVVVLEIVSNWGGSSICLYGVEVHGELST